MSSDGAGGLWEVHRGYLTARAVADDVIAERGYFSVGNRAGLKACGFGQATPIPALLIPLRGPAGDPAGYQCRPDQARTNGEGRALKFEVPHRYKPRVDVHPRSLQLLADPAVPLWVTEGVCKADSLVSVGACAAALLGVWNWQGEALADFELLRLKGRTVYVAFDSDVMVKPAVHEALARLGGFLEHRGAQVGYVYLPDGENGRKVGIDDYLAAGGELDDLLAHHLSTEVRRPAWEPGPDGDPFADVEEEPGWRVLDDVLIYLTRFVHFATDLQPVAVALWIAHTWAFDAADSTPKLSIQSAEKRSGKTRLLEVLELLSRRPVRTASISPAALFRLIEDRTPTLLIDEADAVWKGNTDRAEELRGLINAGSRRGASVYRVVGEGGSMAVKEFPAYTPVAVAGIGEPPDTIADRAVVVRLERRRPNDVVTPFRWRHHAAEAAELALRLGAWATRHLDEFASDPPMPAGLVDRAADTWEPLLAIADAAGGDWPAWSRKAAVELNDVRAGGDSSEGVQLLADLRDLFDAKPTDRLASATVVEKLNANEEREWGGWHGGDGFNKRDLARMLRPFGVRPKVLRIDGATARGYTTAGDDDDTPSPLANAFERYLPPRESSAPQSDVTPETGVTHLIRDVTDVSPVTEHEDEEHAQRTRRTRWEQT